MIRDKNVEWLEKRIYVPAWGFQTWKIVGPSGGATDLGGADGAGAGAPVMSEISTFGFTGGLIGAAGDVFAHVMMVPYDLDRSKQVRCRVWWTQTQGVTTDIMTWLIRYSALAEDGLLIEPATALDTVVPTDASSDDPLAVQATDFGVINKNIIAASAAFLNWYVEADVIGTFSADEVSFLGLEIRYTPRKMSGPEKNLRGGRRLTTNSPLGVTLAATQEG